MLIDGWQVETPVLPVSYLCLLTTCSVLYSNMMMTYKLCFTVLRSVYWFGEKEYQESNILSKNAPILNSFCLPVKRQHDINNQRSVNWKCHGTSSARNFVHADVTDDVDLFPSFLSSYPGTDEAKYTIHSMTEPMLLTKMLSSCFHTCPLHLDRLSPAALTWPTSDNCCK